MEISKISRRGGGGERITLEDLTREIEGKIKQGRENN